MGRRGDGYGSEDHLRRYLEDHQEVLNRKVGVALGVKSSVIEWLPYIATEKGDREHRAVEFLRDTPDAHVAEAWKSFWPTTGKQQNWDVIGRTDKSWLLVEAKASWPEFVTTRCGAKGDGLAKITKSLGVVKKDLGVFHRFDWREAYYQHANRVATLWFLREQGIRANLVGLYFIGDRQPDGSPCPRSSREWEALIEARRLTMGLPGRHALSRFEHHVFLPALTAAPAPAAQASAAQASAASAAALKAKPTAALTALTEPSRTAAKGTKGARHHALTGGKQGPSPRWLDHYTAVRLARGDSPASVKTWRAAQIAKYSTLQAHGLKA